jgi:hypothetical protein
LACFNKGESIPQEAHYYQQESIEEEMCAAEDPAAQSKLFPFSAIQTIELDSVLPRLNPHHRGGPYEHVME